MKRRHVAFITLIVLAMPLLSCALLQQSALIKPEVTIERFDIESISLRDIRLLIEIGITNPYPVNVRLERIAAKLLVEKNQLFQTNTRRGLRMSPGKKECASFVVNLKYADIWRIVSSYAEKDYLESELSGEVVLGLLKSGSKGADFLDSLAIPFQWSKRIPAIKPEIRIINFKIQTPSREDVLKSSLAELLAGRQGTGPTRLELELPVSFDIELKNNAGTRILVKDMHYDFYVDGESLIRGETGEVSTNGNITVARIRNAVRLRSMSESLIKALKKRRADYALKGHSTVRLPEAIKADPLKLVLDEKGSFSP